MLKKQQRHTHTRSLQEQQKARTQRQTIVEQLKRHLSAVRRGRAERREAWGRGTGSKCKRCVLSSLTVDSRVESVECLSVCVCVFKSIYGRIWQGFEQDTIQVDWGKRS